MTGKTITEIDAGGNKIQTNVYVGEAVLAKQLGSGAAVTWTHADPVTGSIQETAQSGALHTRRELEPLGAKVPTSDPNYTLIVEEPNYNQAGHIGSGAWGCTMPDTGMPAPCNVTAFAANYRDRINPTAGNLGQYFYRQAMRMTIPGFIGADNRRDDELVEIPGLRRVEQYEGREFVGFMWAEDNSVAAQRQTQQNNTPIYTDEQRKCDAKLAEIFGGLNAVGAGSGFEPLNLFGKNNKGKGAAKAGQYRGGGDTGHLSSVFHLYYSDDQGENAGEFSGDVYIPEGGEYAGKNPYSSEDSYLFTYKSLGNVKNVVLVTSHVKGFTSPKGLTRRKTNIGDIGGEGGDSSIYPLADGEGKYIHSHLAIRSYTYKYNKKTKRNEIVFGKRHSFFDVFCKK